MAIIPLIRLGSNTADNNMERIICMKIIIIDILGCEIIIWCNLNV